MDQSSDTMKSTNSIAETLRRKKQRERKLKKILQVLYTENSLDTFTMEVPIYIYIQSKRESVGAFSGRIGLPPTVMGWAASCGDGLGCLLR